MGNTHHLLDDGIGVVVVVVVALLSSSRRFREVVSQRVCPPESSRRRRELCKRSLSLGIVINVVVGCRWLRLRCVAIRS